MVTNLFSYLLVILCFQILSDCFGHDKVSEDATIFERHRHNDYIGGVCTPITCESYMITVTPRFKIPKELKIIKLYVNLSRDKNHRWYYCCLLTIMGVNRGLL